MHTGILILGLKELDACDIFRLCLTLVQFVITFKVRLTHTYNVVNPRSSFTLYVSLSDIFLFVVFQMSMNVRQEGTTVLMTHYALMWMVVMTADVLMGKTAQETVFMRGR